MQFYGKAEQVATRILELFQEPDRLPKALAPIFIHRDDNKPCRAWSWSNQLLTALAATDDARGFRQWEKVGRHVTKGSHAFHILGPVTVKRTETDDTGKKADRYVTVGFKSIAVFRYEDTEGDALPDEPTEFMDALPLVSVAEHWGLSVQTFNGQGAQFLGYYRHGQSIALGVENLSTWAHELVHAADDRRGTIVKRSGQVPSNEIVAELGGAILLECLGQPNDADLGGCWNYVRGYDGKHPISACQRLLKRTCEAVALILNTADELAAQAAESEAA